MGACIGATEVWLRRRQRPGRVVTRCSGMTFPPYEHTSGAGAYERNGERVAGRTRGLRGVMDDVSQERLEKELTRRQPFDDAHGRPAARTWPRARRHGIDGRSDGWWCRGDR